MSSTKNWKNKNGILGINTGTYNSVRITKRGVIYAIIEKVGKRAIKTK